MITSEHWELDPGGISGACTAQTGTTSHSGRDLFKLGLKKKVQVAGGSETQLLAEAVGRATLIPGHSPLPTPRRAPCLFQTFSAFLGLICLPELQKGRSALASLFVKHIISESGKELLLREGVRRMDGV